MKISDKINSARNDMNALRQVIFDIKRNREIAKLAKAEMKRFKQDEKIRKEAKRIDDMMRVGKGLRKTQLRLRRHSKVTITKTINSNSTTGE